MSNTINIVLLLVFTLVNNVLMWEALVQTQAQVNEKPFKAKLILSLVIAWTTIVYSTVGTAVYLSLR